MTYTAKVYAYYDKNDQLDAKYLMDWRGEANNTKTATLKAIVDTREQFGYPLYFVIFQHHPKE